MKRQTICLLTALIFFLIGPRSGYAATPMSLYDDFSGGTIDPAKWQNLEAVREIRNGRLVSTLRVGGPPWNPENNLHFINPTAIQSFQADVRLNAYTPPPGGHVKVRLEGSYYNDGTGGPGNLTGDVLAQLYTRGDSTGVSIKYQVIKCLIPTCMGLNGATVLVGPTTVKPAALGEVHTLAIAWDGSVFTFTVDGTATVVDPKPLQPIVRATPNVPFKLLQSQIFIGGAGGEGYVTGDFANVQVNGAAYDNFTGSLIDPTKWADLEFVQDVQNGQLVSKTGWVGAAGTSSRNRLRPTNQNAVTAMQGDVTVTAFQSTNSYVDAQLDGAFYNDGASTGGTDATGNVRGFMRISSTNGGSLTAEFHTYRCSDPQCNSGLTFFSDGLGTVNVGETHTLKLIWDGSAFTYGMDGTTRTYDPKPSYPVVKPPMEHFKDFRTEVYSNVNGGYGYITATLDNVYVNSQALTLPHLARAFQQTVAGDVAAAGVGLRGTGTGTIPLTGIPAGATIQKAFLYWSTVGGSGTFTAPTLNGTAVSGTLIGQSDDPILGVDQAFAYRADVTSLIAGNGSYTIYGLPAGPLPPASTTVNDSQGASLVVIYLLPPGAPSRTITINDGAVTLIGPAVSAVGARLQEYTTALTGFLAANPPTGAHLTFLVGNGQSLTPEYAGLNTTLLATNGFSGSDGTAWDTKTYDVSTAMAAGDSSAQAVVSTGNEALVWVAAILSVPGSPQATLTLGLNQPFFHQGQQLALSATVTPGTAPLAADVYVALQLPDGSLLFLQGDGTFTGNLQPIVRNWTISPFTGQIFAYTFSGGEPVGNYAWFAAFTQPGTLNFIGPIVSAPFSFSP